MIYIFFFCVWLEEKEALKMGYVVNTEFLFQKWQQCCFAGKYSGIHLLYDKMFWLFGTLTLVSGTSYPSCSSPPPMQLVEQEGMMSQYICM